MSTNENNKASAKGTVHQTAEQRSAQSIRDKANNKSNNSTSSETLDNTEPVIGKLTADALKVHDNNIRTVPTRSADERSIGVRSNGAISTKGAKLTLEQLKELCKKFQKIDPYNQGTTRNVIDFTVSANKNNTVICIPVIFNDGTFTELPEYDETNILNVIRTDCNSNGFCNLVMRKIGDFDHSYMSRIFYLLSLEGIAVSCTVDADNMICIAARRLKSAEQKSKSHVESSSSSEYRNFELLIAKFQKYDRYGQGRETVIPNFTYGVNNKPFKCAPYYIKKSNGKLGEFETGLFNMIRDKCKATKKFDIDIKLEDFNNSCMSRIFYLLSLMRIAVSCTDSINDNGEPGVWIAARKY
jgi:hypothetical protein